MLIMFSRMVLITRSTGLNLDGGKEMFPFITSSYSNYILNTIKNAKFYIFSFPYFNTYQKHAGIRFEKRVIHK